MRSFREKDETFMQAFKKGLSIIGSRTKQSPPPVHEFGKQMSEVIKQQSQEAEQVISYKEFVKTTFAWSEGSEADKLDLLHVWGAIAGEYIELRNELEEHEKKKGEYTSEQEFITQWKKCEKELGDLCYYIYMVANLTDVTLPQVNKLFNAGEPKALENFMDAVKKKIFYKIPDVDLHVPIIELWNELNFIAESRFLKPIEYFILQNKEKLMKRYPLGKFSTTDAAEKKDTHNNA